VRNEEETDLRLRHLRWHRDDLKCRPDEPNCRQSLVWLTRESRIPLQDSLQPVRSPFFLFFGSCITESKIRRRAVGAIASQGRGRRQAANRVNMRLRKAGSLL
jgi:hypothetical protein